MPSSADPVDNVRGAAVKSPTLVGMNPTPGAASAAHTTPHKHQPRTQRSPYDGLPYEDEDGYERRWGGLSETAKTDLSHSDPLTFIADHLPHRDRSEGSVVVLLQPIGFGQPMVNVISDCPRNPTAEECYRLLWPFATAASRACPPDGRAMLGLIHHRRGPAVVGVLDQRWLGAVHQAAQEAGIEVVGVMVRTASGALLAIKDAEAA
jgi:hypothetical protein